VKPAPSSLCLKVALGMAAILFRSGRHRRQRPRSPAEAPDAVVTDVPELEAAIAKLVAGDGEK